MSLSLMPISKASASNRGIEMHYDNRRKDKAQTRQRRQARVLKYAGLVELAVNLEIAEIEGRLAVAELTGGAR